ncbi:heart- and neural crest derivatives-expressed protein 2 [Cololabis saira]|uniref:heart- and neural crest derivatives-expressed protein 2 n=1 Tax=Cololabis saira TaxID=129043 RepID=UPI002AD5544F|nr:heart- and neural crest derivatives-expressed protein 2 [Cololabis saira]
MSLVSGFPHPALVHPHDGHHYSMHAAAGDGGAPPYFTSWVIGHADVSAPEYGYPPGYSPEYHGTEGGGAAGPDPHHHHQYGHGSLIPRPAALSTVAGHPHPHPRPVKRRPTANRKERRRTQSINTAFAELRDCIPNVPADTKLSKIKTLRLATSYISYLMDILDKDGPHGDAHCFKAELRKSEGRESRRREPVEIPKAISSSSSSSSSSPGDKKSKGRTGWPQHVWALELKQ